MVPGNRLAPRRLSLEHMNVKTPEFIDPNKNFKLLSSKDLDRSKKLLSKSKDNERSSINSYPSTEKEKQDCSQRLNPQELHQIVIGPSTVNFGRVCQNSACQGQLQIVNNLSQYIHIGVQLDCRELRQSGPLAQVIAPNSGSYIPLVFESATLGKFQRNLTYILNGAHQNHVIVLADVVPVRLHMSTQFLELFPNPGMPCEAGLRSVIELQNPLNHPAEFLWEPVIKSSGGIAFSIRPKEGIVDPFSSIDCEVVFHASFNAPDDGEFLLRNPALESQNNNQTMASQSTSKSDQVGTVNPAGSSSCDAATSEDLSSATTTAGNLVKSMRSLLQPQKLHCVARMGSTLIKFQNRRVMFGVLPINMATVRKAVMVNSGPNHAYFRVIVDSLYRDYPGMMIYPLRGILPVGGQAELLIKFTPETVGKFDCVVPVVIRGWREIELRMNGNVVVPQVEIPERTFDFQGTFVGSSSEKQFQLINRSACKACVEFNLSRNPDFSIKFRQDEFIEDAIPKASNNTTTTSKVYSLLPSHHPAPPVSANNQIHQQNQQQQQMDEDDYPQLNANVYRVVLMPEEKIWNLLVFSPTEIASYDFNLPVTINKITPPPSEPTPFPRTPGPPNQQHNTDNDNFSSPFGTTKPPPPFVLGPGTERTSKFNVKIKQLASGANDSMSLQRVGGGGSGAAGGGDGAGKRPDTRNTRLTPCRHVKATAIRQPLRITMDEMNFQVPPNYKPPSAASTSTAGHILKAKDTTVANTNTSSTAAKCIRIINNMDRVCEWEINFKNCIVKCGSTAQAINSPISFTKSPFRIYTSEYDKKNDGEQDNFDDTVVTNSNSNTNSGNRLGGTLKQTEDSATIYVEFLPNRPGYYQVTLPLFARFPKNSGFALNDEDVPYKTMHLNGVYPAPQLIFYPSILCMTPVPLGMEISANFMICARNFTQCDELHVTTPKIELPEKPGSGEEQEIENAQNSFKRRQQRSVGAKKMKAAADEFTDSSVAAAEWTDESTYQSISPFKCSFVQGSEIRPNSSQLDDIWIPCRLTFSSKHTLSVRSNLQFELDKLDLCANLEICAVADNCLLTWYPFWEKHQIDYQIVCEEGKYLAGVETTGISRNDAIGEAQLVPIDHNLHATAGQVGKVAVNRAIAGNKDNHHIVDGEMLSRMSTTVTSSNFEPSTSSFDTGSATDTGSAYLATPAVLRDRAWNKIGGKKGEKLPGNMSTPSAGGKQPAYQQAGVGRKFIRIDSGPQRYSSTSTTVASETADTKMNRRLMHGGRAGSSASEESLGMNGISSSLDTLRQQQIATADMYDDQAFLLENNGFKAAKSGVAGGAIAGTASGANGLAKIQRQVQMPKPLLEMLESNVNLEKNAEFYPTVLNIVQRWLSFFGWPGGSCPITIPETFRSSIERKMGPIKGGKAGEENLSEMRALQQHLMQQQQHGINTVSNDPMSGAVDGGGGGGGAGSGDDQDSTGIGSTTFGVSAENRGLYDMITHLSGRSIPGIPMTSMLPNAPLEQVKQIYWQHHALITFIERQGGCLAVIRPEYLMDWHQYELWYSLHESINTPFNNSNNKNNNNNENLDNAGRGGSSFVSAAPQVQQLPFPIFNRISRWAWTHLLIQFIKVAVLAKVTLHSYRQLHQPNPNLPLPPVQRQSTVSNCYNVSERILLAWLNHYFENYRHVIWPNSSASGSKRGATTSGSSSNNANANVVAADNLLDTDQDSNLSASTPAARWLINFDNDLMDGLVFATVLGAHMPFLIESHLRHMYTRPKTPEQCLHNALRIINAIRTVNIDFDIQAIDLVDPHPIMLLLFTAHLYYTCPQYIPKTRIEFQGALHETIVRQVSLQNPSHKQMTYHCILAGRDATDFSIVRTPHISNAANIDTNSNQPILAATLPSKGSIKLQLQFKSRFLRPASAMLILVGQRTTSTYPTNTVFHLVSKVTAINPNAIERSSGPCFSLKMVPILVHNPFPPQATTSSQHHHHGHHQGNHHHQQNHAQPQNKASNTIASRKHHQPPDNAHADEHWAEFKVRLLEGYEDLQQDAIHMLTGTAPTSNQMAGAMPGNNNKMVAGKATRFQLPGAAEESLAVANTNPPGNNNSNSNSLKSFFCHTDRVRLGLHTPTRIDVFFLPFHLGRKQCCLIFSNERIGEFVYAVDAMADLPLPTTLDAASQKMSPSTDREANPDNPDASGVEQHQNPGGAGGMKRKMLAKNIVNMPVSPVNANAVSAAETLATGSSHANLAASANSTSGSAAVSTVIQWSCEVGAKINDVIYVPIANKQRESALLLAAQHHLSAEEVTRRKMTGTLTSESLMTKALNMLKLKPSKFGAAHKPKLAAPVQEAVKTQDDAAANANTTDILDAESSDLSMKKSMERKYNMKSNMIPYAVETTSKYFITPNKILIPDPNVLMLSNKNKDGKLGAPSNSSSSGDEDFVEIPITIQTHSSGLYPCSVILRGPDDVRVYRLEVTVVPEGSTAKLTFTTPVNTEIKQDVPLLNQTAQDWQLKTTLSGATVSFCGPENLLVKAYTTGHYPLIFRPQKEGNMVGFLTLKNVIDGTEHCFELHGEGLRPLAVDHLSIETSVGETLTRNVHVPNLTRLKRNFVVESDIEWMLSGKDSITVLPNRHASYQLIVKPVKRGHYKGIIAFIAGKKPLLEYDSDGDEVVQPEQLFEADSSAGKLASRNPKTSNTTSGDTEYKVWYSVEVYVAPGPALASINVSCYCQQTVPIKIPLRNPSSGHCMQFQIAIEGDGSDCVSGPATFTLEPNQTGYYKAAYKPHCIGKKTASIVIYNSITKEFWYELFLEALSPSVTVVDDIKCELGKWSIFYLDLKNPSPNEQLLLHPEVSNETVYSIDLAHLELNEGDAAYPGGAQIQLEPLHSVKIPIRFCPNQLGTLSHHAWMTFHSDMLGAWKFELRGCGVEPEPNETLAISAAAGSNTTALIQFQNPMLVPVLLDIRLREDREFQWERHKMHLQIFENDEEIAADKGHDISEVEDDSTGNIFRLLLKKTHSIKLDAKASLDIPISFAPHDMCQYEGLCSVVMRRKDGLPISNFQQENLATATPPSAAGNDTDAHVAEPQKEEVYSVRWLFPVKGVPEALPNPGTYSVPNIQARIRQTVCERLEVTLFGVTSLPNKKQQQQTQPQTHELSVNFAGEVGGVSGDARGESGTEPLHLPAISNNSSCIKPGNASDPISKAISEFTWSWELFSGAPGEATPPHQPHHQEDCIIPAANHQAAQHPRPFSASSEASGSMIRRDLLKLLSTYTDLELIGRHQDSGSGMIVLTFQVTFCAWRQFKLECNLVVRSAAGGVWRYPVKFSTTDSLPDDVIGMKCVGLNRATSCKIWINSQSVEPSPFVAFFETNDDNEFTCDTSSGILPATADQSSAAENKRKDDKIPLIITWTPKSYGKTKVAKLIVQTPNMEWAYLINGFLPEYSPPKASSVVVKEISNLSAMSIEKFDVIGKRQLKSQKRNFILENINLKTTGVSSTLKGAPILPKLV